MADWGEGARRLEPLVDGWEALLAETLDVASITAFADGRAAGWTALAERMGSEDGRGAIGRAARRWALADLALHLSAAPEAGLARDLALGEDDQTGSLPRTLRPLAVLHGLALRAVRRGSSETLDGPGAMMVVLRIGLSGR